ncbi:MAG: hypothetical protein WCK00_13010 [Deltaproteobacteria bacterium]
MEVKIVATNKDEVMKIYTSEDGFHIPSIAMRALNMTADQVKQRLIDDIAKQFDRPVPYTLNAPGIDKRATKNSLSIRVFAKSGRQASYLEPQEFGGGRRLKSFEKALNRIGILPNGKFIVPGKNAPLDAYGNVSSGFIVQILAYFKAFPEGARRSNMSDIKKEKMAKGTKKKLGIEYFVLHGRNSNPGIFSRVSFGGGQSIRPIFFFVDAPHYKKRLAWNETAARVVDENWKQNFDEASQGL